MRECLLRVPLDEGFDECGLSYSRRTDNRNDDWWRFFGQSVDEGDMQSLFFDLDNAKSDIVESHSNLDTYILRSSSLLVESPWIRDSKCFDIFLYRKASVEDPSYKVTEPTSMSFFLLLFGCAMRPVRLRFHPVKLIEQMSQAQL
jgi:hypothetical protein